MLDYTLIGNITIGQLMNKAADVLDGGPNSLAPGTAAGLALATPFMVFLCVIFMSTCQKRRCCGGMCHFYWFTATGFCKGVCGGEPLIPLGTAPETGLQPDEEATDPEIMGDYNNLSDAPTEGTTDNDENHQESNFSATTMTNSDRSQQECCRTVAAVLDGESQAVAKSVMKKTSNGKGKASSNSKRSVQLPQYEIDDL